MAVLTLVVGCSSAQALGQQSAALTRCDAPELVGYQPYDDLVCSAIEAYESGDVVRARGEIERALGIALHEVPNVLLYPRLAYVTAVQGDTSAAADALRRAQVVVGLYTDLYRCADGSGDSTELWDHFGDPVPLDSSGSEVASVMCAPAFDYMYWQQRDVDSLQWEYEIAAIYIRAAAALGEVE